MSDLDPDDPMRKRMRAADPAWRQVPLTDDEAMLAIRTARASQERIAPGEVSATPSGPSRGWLYVAAAMVLIGGAGYVITSQAGDDRGKDPGTSQQAPPVGSNGGMPQGAGPIQLQMGTQAKNARCAPTTAEFLRQQDLAFAGTPTEVQGRKVTLRVDEIFKGQPATEAVVTAPVKATSRTVYAVDFLVGKQYLVSATDGQVSLCGASDVDTPTLRDLYVQAY